MFNKNNNKRIFIVYNQYIKSDKVRCIDHTNKNLGIVSTQEAMRLAKSVELDLVQISPPDRDGVPICKMVDYGKYKYELSLKQKENAKKQRESEVKVHEIKFRPNTDLNDLKTKAAKAKEFLDDGDRIKISIVFKGREIQHQNVAKETLSKFIEFVSDIQLISDPCFQGKVLSVIAVKGKVNDNNQRAPIKTAV